MKALPRLSNVVVLGGTGAVGALFCARLASASATVTAVDLKVPDETQAFPGVRYLPADVRDPGVDVHEVLTAADAVMVALPEDVTLASWGGIVAAMRDCALFVDTLSVKTPLLSAIQAAGVPNEVISINPMFAPSLGFSGQSAAVVEVRRGPFADAFLAALESWGCRLVHISAEEHDRCTSALQTVTHAAILAFGMSLRKLNYDLEAMLPLMPPPHRAMLALLARILQGDPSVYWDIQSGNPYSPGARAALKESIDRLSVVLDGGEQTAFRETLANLRALFAPEQLSSFQETCARMFDVAGKPSGGAAA